MAERYSNMRDILAQIREGYSPKEVKMAIGIASDPRYKGGNYTGAVTAIEKIKKGLSKHPQVAAVLKRQNEDVDPSDTGGEEEVSMAMTQLAGIRHFVDGIEMRVKSAGDMEEWYQNKLTKAHDYLKTIYAYGKGDVAESLEEGKSSTGYELYHKDFSSAMKHAYDFAKKKFGIEVDPKEIDDKVASGPRKPSKGKTNSYRLLGKDGKKAIQVQVYGMDNGKYELNMYKESVDLEEGAFGELQIAAKDLAKYASKDKKDMDYKDFMKAAAMMKTGKVKELAKFTNDLDTEPRDKIIDMVKGAIGKTAAEKLFNVTIREEVELTEKLKVSDGLGAWIDDFMKSDAPQFKGKSDEEKKNMAIAAFTDAGGKLDESKVLASKGKSKVVSKDGVAKVMVKGKEVASGDYDDGAGGWFMSRKGDKGQKFFDSPQKIIDFYKEEYATEEVELKIKEEEEPQKPDSAKEVEQGREDKKKTRIAQLQLQIAKAQETINKLNAQEK